MLSSKLEAVVTQMGTNRKVYGFLFSSIFFLKMVVSTVPIYASLYDPKHVAAIIMQLELENHAGKSSDDLSSEKLNKEFPTITDWNIFIMPIRYLAVKQHIADEKLHVKSFYLTIPTPPPDC